MRFGPVPVAQALGAILAHRETAGEVVLAKGHVLTAPDLTALAAAGLTQVTVAQLDPSDVGEDTAAGALAAAGAVAAAASSAAVRASHSSRVSPFT